MKEQRVAGRLRALPGNDRLPGSPSFQQTVRRSQETCGWVSGKLRVVPGWRGRPWERSLLIRHAGQKLSGPGSWGWLAALVSDEGHWTWLNDRSCSQTGLPGKAEEGASGRFVVTVNKYGVVVCSCRCSRSAYSSSWGNGDFASRFENGSSQTSSLQTRYVLSFCWLAQKVLVLPSPHG